MIILNTIRGTGHLGVFEAWNTSYDALLDVLGHAVRDAVRVNEI